MRRTIRSTLNFRDAPRILVLQNSGCVPGSPTSLIQPQDVEPVIQELHELQADLLDAVPGCRPVLDIRGAKDRSAADSDSGRRQNCCVYKGGTPASKTRRHNYDGPDMFTLEKSADLTCGIQTGWFALLHRNDLHVSKMRRTGHDFDDLLRHDIFYFRIDLRSHRDECSRCNLRLFECGTTLEKKVIRIKVLHQECVALFNSLLTHEALSDFQSPFILC